MSGSPLPPCQVLASSKRVDVLPGLPLQAAEGRVACDNPTSQLASRGAWVYQARLDPMPCRPEEIDNILLDVIHQTYRRR